MFLSKVTIVNIRNIGELDLTFERGLTVFAGLNGQGKTNILEAIYLLSHARSFRNARNEHLIKFGEEFGYIDAELQRQGHEVPLRVVLQKQGRAAFVYGKRCGRLSDLAGQVHFVTFDVTDLQTVSATPGQRRSMLDKIVFNIFPGYIHTLREYEKILLQRNHLLGIMRAGKGSPAELDIWTRQLVTSGVQVIDLRMKVVEQINAVFPETHKLLTAIAENPRICYKISLYGGNEEQERKHGTEAMQEYFYERLQEHRRSDIERGFTQIGPHRDDFAILLQQRDMRHVSSQGEQRTAVIALKLAEFTLFQQKYGEAPVVLFDDVFSELDPKRAELLLLLLEQGKQILLSCTQVEYVRSRRRDFTLYEVSQGKVNKV